MNWITEAKQIALLASQYLITPAARRIRPTPPELADLPRAEAAARFVECHPCTLLFKGARPLIAAPGEDIRFNSTGHSGMASGDQRDILAGVCVGLLASNLKPTLVVWLCGRGAERAITHATEIPESTIATHTIINLGGAFTDWRERRR